MKGKYIKCKCGLKKIRPKIVCLKVGDRVFGENEERTPEEYTGIIECINSNRPDGGLRATVKRDDMRTGGGERISEYGSGWAIWLWKKYWKSDGRKGEFLRKQFCKRCIKISNIKK